MGPDWRWSEDCKDEKYLDIVKLFEDRKASVYSIHQAIPVEKLLRTFFVLICNYFFKK